MPDFDHRTTLFIGWLIETKKVDELFDYYTILKEHILRSGKRFKLEILGDDSFREFVMNYAEEDEDIIYHGAVHEEKNLPEIFKRVCFVLGLSELSVNHAFLYGRPYITAGATDYTDLPEIDYKISSHNGYIHSGSVSKNTNLLLPLINYREKLKGLYEGDYETNKLLNIYNLVNTDAEIPEE